MEKSYTIANLNNGEIGNNLLRFTRKLYYIQKINDSGMSQAENKDPEVHYYTRTTYA